MTFRENNLKMLGMAQSAFAQWLNETMEALGLTQEGLGNKVDVSHVTVSKWQRGRHLPDPKQLRRLAIAAGVDDVWLFRLVGYIAPEEPDGGKGSSRKPANDTEQLAARIMRLPPGQRAALRQIVESMLKGSEGG